MTSHAAAGTARRSSSTRCGARARRFLHRRKIIRHIRPHEHTDTATRGIGTATQAHYDLLYLREGSDQVLSMWIPLGSCPTRLGGLVYLEGSPDGSWPRNGRA